MTKAWVSFHRRILVLFRGKFTVVILNFAGHTSSVPPKVSYTCSQNLNIGQGISLTEKFHLKFFRKSVKLPRFRVCCFFWKNFKWNSRLSMLFDIILKPKRSTRPNWPVNLINFGSLVSYKKALEARSSI